MSFTKITAFLMAVFTLITFGVVPVVGSTDASGVSLGTTRVAAKYRPGMLTADPVLCGCFSEKEGNGGAYVFTNMYNPQKGKTAAFSATFPGAKSVTLYRKGEKTVIPGGTLNLMLDNREDVFVTVERSPGFGC